MLISGEKSQRLRLKTLVTHLDTPLETGGDTQVRYLNYADAEQIAGKLKEQITGITQAAPGRARRAGRPQAAADRSTTIWADPADQRAGRHRAAEDHALRSCRSWTSSTSVALRC